MYEVLVYLSVVSAAMLVGLMTTLLTVLRPIWAQQPEDAAARSFQTFLRFATPNPILLLLSFIPVISAIIIAFLDAPGTGEYVSALVGGGVFFVGYFACTALVNTPIYKIVMTWDPETSPEAVTPLLQRFHKVNLIRLAATVATTILFFAAA
ncbi:anthrone oxygenase family protein [Amycolatopsis anabasis]|uniref:anthrone oxygenase family protein n=1 Tax=Amycolatopsis anabasis TaxID=1840409 RepID=UPI00131CB5CF|nr:anthrone oxygenase family protein [Amycolatopsis anabasis]